MRVLITGAGGFIGQQLVRKLLKRGELTTLSGETRPVRELILADRCIAALPFGTTHGITVSARAGDLCDSGFLESLFHGGLDSIFHLAASLTIDAERDLDRGWAVNARLPFHLMEFARRSGTRPRFVYSRSIAVFGGRLPERVVESQVQRPATSYGTAKAITELLINDYSRHGFIDGRALRLPIVLIRPGKREGSPPSGAFSDVIAALAREPLAGRKIVSPLSWTTRFPVVSISRVAENLIRIHEVAAERFQDSRAVNQPGLTISVRDIAASLERLGGAEVAALLKVEPREEIERVVAGWPRYFDSELSFDPPLEADPDFDSILRDYMQEMLNTR